MTNEEKIILLSNAWCNYVYLDHHKDRDCHFYITTKYSYGDKPIYLAEHYGYVGENFEVPFATYEEAEKGLESLIRKLIKDQIDWLIAVEKEPDQYDKHYTNGKARKELEDALQATQ